MKEKQLHISAGRGPAECMFVVAKVLKAVCREAKNDGLEIDVVKRIEGTMERTLISAIVLVRGQHAQKFVDSWTGSVLWIGQSPYRKFHKRKNWFIEVFEGESQNDEALNYTDIRFKATKSSGPGGQHVNKTSSAVRATHLPTGLSVLVQDSRSQHQNKKIAFERLQEVYARKRKEMIDLDELNQWKQGIEVQRGNPSRTYEGKDFRQRNKN